MIIILYPLKFEPIYKRKIWGGRNLSDNFNRSLPSGLIGESWEISARKNEESRVINGRFKGETLTDIIKKEKVNILGLNTKEDYFSNFPLLIKILDANTKLSVQVHPNDKYASKFEGKSELGKTEMWYIIDAKQNSKIIYGIKDNVNKKDFKNYIKNGKIKEKLKEINVEPGDVIYIPSGTVHAIGEDILVAEIQQNSDTTYRVYDWDRLDENGNTRKLNIKSALEVINFNNKCNAKAKGLKIKKNGYIKNICVACPYFITEILDISKKYKGNTKFKRFYIYMAIEGEAKLKYSNDEINIYAGETILLPADIGVYEIIGNCKLIKTYIRDIDKLKLELKNKGFSDKQIQMIKGLN